MRDVTHKAKQSHIRVFFSFMPTVRKKKIILIAYTNLNLTWEKLLQRSKGTFTESYYIRAMYFILGTCILPTTFPFGSVVRQFPSACRWEHWESDTLTGEPKLCT